MNVIVLKFTEQNIIITAVERLAQVTKSAPNIVVGFESVDNIH